MATEILLNYKIDNANASKSIGDLSKSLKELTALQARYNVEGTRGYEKLQKAINETEDRLGNLKDGFNTLRGSGVERLNSSLGLLREGLAGADPGKIGIAFKGLSAAMSAVPIFLLIEGFKLLTENFDKVAGFVKLVTNSFSEEEKQVKSLTKQLEENKKTNTALTASLQNTIKILEAQGQSEDKIIAAKKELTAIQVKELQLDTELQKAKIRQIIANDSLFEGGERLAAQALRLQGNTVAADAIEKKIAIDKKERLKEATDQLRTDFITIQNLKTDEQVLDIKKEKEKSERVKKNNDDAIAESKRLADELFAQESKNQDVFREQEEAERARLKKEKEEKAKQDQTDFEAALNEGIKQEELRTKTLQDEIAKRKAIIEAEERARFDIAKAGVTSIQGLSDLAFSIRLANTKKGTSEEEKAARNQFKINKALQIASASITGIQGALSAATAKSILPEPLATALRVANVVAITATTAATIAKISATQFNSGASSSGAASVGSGSSSGSTSVGAGAVIPQSNIQASNFNIGTVGQVGQPGGKSLPGGQNNNGPNVSVTEIHKVSNKVKTTELQAKFG